MPKLSVCIPVYGVEKYIERCARSLFEQTLNDIEFIFVDDCTPDRSIDILRSIIEEYRLRFAEKKHSVRIERMPTNSGQAAVRRHGMQLATGDYIIHCDSDDWVDVTMYEKMYEAAEKHKADMIICDFYIDSTDKSTPYSHKNTTDFVESFLAENISWVVWNKMIRRDLVSENIVFPGSNMGEDMLLTLQYILRSNNIVIIHDCLYHYIYNPSSISNNCGKYNVLSRYYGALQNINDALILLNEKNMKQKYTAGVMQLKYHARRHLIPIINQPEIYKLWKNTYPEINKLFVFQSKIRLSSRIQFVVLFFKLNKLCPNYFK